MQHDVSDTPLRTSFTLRPHHIQLLKILMMAFQVYLDLNPPLPPPFVLHIHRLALNEISEIMQPRSYEELFQDISSGPMADLPLPRKFVEDLRAARKDLDSPQQLANFFSSLPTLFADKDEDDETTAPFSHRSLFGYFFRRCFVTFCKLSMSALARLHSDYMVWSQPNASRTDDSAPLPGYQFILKDTITNDHQIFKTKIDDRHCAIPDAYGLFEKSQAVGDMNLATEYLRKFFEQRFHEGSDSNLRQHALLNIARMHYLNREYASARKFLQEGVGVARTSNDRITLQHCISLLHRLPPLEEGQKYTLNEIQANLHPLEILFDVKKLMHISNQQPLTACFEKIIQAVGLYDNWLDVQHAPFVESEQWGQHTIQSIVWSMHGCTRIGEIEENIVTAFTEAGGDDNNRLVVTLNRAYQRARQGKYQDALAMMLEPDVWRGITLNDYHVWATEIWHILVLRASRRGQHRQFSDFLKQKRTEGAYKSREYWFWGSAPLGSMIRDPLYEVMQMRGVEQAHACVEQLLTALWHAELQCRFGLYRVAIVILADIGLEFGMTKWCRRIIDEIMPQIITGNDLELKAFACFTLARCIIAAGDSSPGALQECLPYLLIAEKDYITLEALRSLQDVQYVVSIVYHNLGMTAERDEAATRHLETEKEVKKAAEVVVENWIAEVWEVVAEVGAALAAR